MADAVGSVVKKLLGQTSRDRAANDIDKCKFVHIPTIPYGCIEVNDEWLVDMRDKGRDDEKKTVAAYTAYEIAKAGAILENENRLRGVLWCYRALREAYAADPKDTELAFLGKKVRAFIEREWSIADPPMDRIECNTLAMRTVAGLVRP